VPHPSVLRVRVLTFLFASRLLLNLFPRQNIHRSARWPVFFAGWVAREADLEAHSLVVLQIKMTPSEGACRVMFANRQKGTQTMSAQTNWKQLEDKINSSVKLSRRPVAVSFLDAAPANVKRFDGTEPSGCSFWRLAANGAVFYTVPENHFNCAVGAYTHNITLSPEREKETEQTLKMMFDLG
jgi:hypothetical protein